MSASAASQSRCFSVCSQSPKLGLQHGVLTFDESSRLLSTLAASAASRRRERLSWCNTEKLQMLCRARLVLSTELIRDRQQRQRGQVEERTAFPCGLCTSARMPRKLLLGCCATRDWQTATVIGFDWG